MGNEKFQARFGDTIKQLRNRLAITQEELAGRAGLHRTYVADIERGARNVSLESIEKLAAALEISLPALFASATEPRQKIHLSKGLSDGNDLVEVFLVEDDARDVELTQRAFKRARFTNPLQILRDGAEALDFFFGTGANKFEGRRAPSLVLLDLYLPKVSGLEVLRRLKADESLRRIPVIVLTASQRSRDIIESQALGADGYLVKPVGFENFSQIAPKLSLHWALLSPSSRFTA